MTVPGGGTPACTSVRGQKDAVVTVKAINTLSFMFLSGPRHLLRVKLKGGAIPVASRDKLPDALLGTLQRVPTWLRAGRRPSDSKSLRLAVNSSHTVRVDARAYRPKALCQSFNARRRRAGRRQVSLKDGRNSTG